MKISSIKEPLAVYSNLAYAIVSLVIAFRQPANLLLIGSLFTLAVVSGAFHMRGSVHGTPAHRADEGIIYAVLGILLFQAWGSPLWLVLVTVAGISVLILNLKKANLSKIAPVLSAVIIAGIAVSGNWFIAGFTLLLGLTAGYVRFRIPESDKQHALWHVLSAIALYFAWAGISFMN